MRVFKYTGHLTQILQNQTVKVSRATDLNDPFELAPQIDPAKLTLEETIKLLSAEITINLAFKKEAGKGETPRQFRRGYLKTIRRRAKAVLPNIKSNVEFTKARFAKVFSEHWRLFCASRLRDSIPMWSHYADDHKGAVVEFDTSAEPFRTYDRQALLFPVDYVKEKPEFPLVGLERANYLLALISVTRSKSEEWEQEQEVRMMVPVEHCRGDFFMPFDPLAIRKVYFGARTTDTQPIQELLNQPNYDHVGIVQFRLSTKCYGLDEEELRPELTTKVPAAV